MTSRRKELGWVQHHYQLLRSAHPEFTHKELWRLAEEAASTETGFPPAKPARPARPGELGDKKGVSWFFAGAVSVFLATGISLLTDSSVEAWMNGESTIRDLGVIVFIGVPAVVAVGIGVGLGWRFGFASVIFIRAFLLATGIAVGVFFVIPTIAGDEEAAVPAAMVAAPFSFVAAFVLIGAGVLIGGLAERRK